MKRLILPLCLLGLLCLSGVPVNADSGFDGKVKHDYADNNGVKIHYASIGQGPLIVMIHGFPDFWYTWRKQMEALSPNYQVVAIDQRGYNLSDKPKGVENYDMRLLVSDVAAAVVAAALLVLGGTRDVGRPHPLHPLRHQLGDLGAEHGEGSADCEA